MRVLLVGDVIIDEYHTGTALGLSAETPTIVAELRSSRKYVGGAGLVARHMLRLGAEVHIVTIGGPSDALHNELSESSDAPTKAEMQRLYIDCCYYESGWCFTRKRRYFVDGYKLLQFDTLNRGSWEDDERDISSFILKRLKATDYDAVVLSDNRHGVLDTSKKDLVALIKSVSDAPLYVDSQSSQKKSNLEKYDSADVLVMNEREAAELNSCYNGGHGPGDVNDFLRNLTRMRGNRVVLKRGAKGASTFEGPREKHYPGMPVKTVDTCGAGDAFLAALVVERNVSLANIWAARSTTYEGTIVPTMEEHEEAPARQRKRRRGR